MDGILCNMEIARHGEIISVQPHTLRGIDKVGAQSWQMNAFTSARLRPTLLSTLVKCNSLLNSHFSDLIVIPANSLNSRAQNILCIRLPSFRI